MAASNHFGNQIPTRNQIPNINISTRNHNVNDISNAFYNGTISNNNFNTTGILVQDAAPADWTDTQTDFSGLIMNPKRSLEAILEERRLAIDTQVATRPAGSDYERLKSELIGFVNSVVSKSAKLFAGDPDSFEEAAALNSQFGSARPNDTDDTAATLSAELESLKVDGQTPLDNFKLQFVWLLDKYKSVGQQLKKAESTLQGKLDHFDKLRSEVSLLLNNKCSEPEFLALEEAYLTYIKKKYGDTEVEEAFNVCMDLYKQFGLIRDIVIAARISVSGGDHGAPTCGICMEDPVSSALSACGHTFCNSCLRQLGRSCAICRKAITGSIKLYFT